MAAKRKTAAKVKGLSRVLEVRKQRNHAAAVAARVKREQAAEARRWKPVRRGSRYCSPACGRGCTIAEHRRAKATAKKLVKELGAGWTFRVYENLGWHHEAISKSGRVRVNKSKHGYYMAHIGDNGDQGCYWSGSGNTARAAIEAAKAKACEALTKNLGRYFDLMPHERIAGFSIQAASGKTGHAKARGMHLLK